MLDHGDETVIFDLGTGMRGYGLSLAPEAFVGYRASVLLSHLHWDHVQGLPFFAPLGCPDTHLDIYGPAQDGADLGAVFDGFMSQPYFPISVHDMPGTAEFLGVGTNDFPVGRAKVRSRWIRHTSPTLGYRVDFDDVSVAYVSDHGPGCSDDSDDFIPEDVLELADGVDLLIHDAQHTVEEFDAKRHYGHSTVDYAVHVARQSGARRLALFHHCPTHTDEDVDRNLAHAQDLASSTGICEVLAASETATVRLEPRT